MQPSKPKRKGDNQVISHARRELELAGTFKKTEDYDGSIGRATLALVKIFSAWTAGDNAKGRAIKMAFDQLVAGELLSQPTTNPNEWETIEGANPGTVRNKRCPFYVSSDYGRTWMHLQNKQTGKSVTFKLGGSDGDIQQEAKENTKATGTGDSVSPATDTGDGVDAATSNENSTGTSNNSEQVVAGSELKPGLENKSTENTEQPESTPAKS